jgi:hypothetical protein
MLYDVLLSWQVSWIRRKDYHLLTVGLATYSSDDRFLVEHVRHLQVYIAAFYEPINVYSIHYVHTIPET